MENLKKYIPIYLRVCRTLALFLYSLLSITYLKAFVKRMFWYAA